MNYSDPSNHRRNHLQAKSWFTMLAKGDAQVFDLCWSTYQFSQMLDDLVDGDKPVTHADAAKATLELFTTLLLNPFVIQHRQILWGGLSTAVMRWLDGDEWENSSDPEKRALAPAVRCGDIDFWLLVARLHGGWNHERALKEFRGYDPSDKQD